MPGGLI